MCGYIFQLQLGESLEVKLVLDAFDHIRRVSNLNSKYLSLICPLPINQSTIPSAVPADRRRRWPIFLRLGLSLVHD